jgi:hypothetical protein
LVRLGDPFAAFLFPLRHGHTKKKTFHCSTMSGRRVSTPAAIASGNGCSEVELVGSAGRRGMLCRQALHILLQQFVKGTGGCVFRFERPHDYVAGLFEVPCTDGHVVHVGVRVNLLGEVRVAVSLCASYELTTLLWTYANFCSVLSGQITRTCASSAVRGVMFLQLDAAAHGAKHELAHARACRLFLHGLDQLRDGIGGIQPDYSIYFCLQALEQEALRSHAGSDDGDECAADGGISDNDPEDAEGKQDDGEGKNGEEEGKEDRRRAHEAGIARAVAAAFYRHSVEPELAVWAQRSSFVSDVAIS